MLERYLAFGYFGEVSDSIDVLRHNEFEHTTHNNLRLLPPSRLGLIEHIKRSAYYSGWINHQCIENVILPDASAWGWAMVGGLYQPIWHTRGDRTINADDVTKVCGCTTAKCTTCKCAQLSYSCLTFCNCQKKCYFTPL